MRHFMQPESAFCHGSRGPLFAEPQVDWDGEPRLNQDGDVSTVFTSLHNQSSLAHYPYVLSNCTASGTGQTYEFAENRGLSFCTPSDQSLIPEEPWLWSNQDPLVREELMPDYDLYFDTGSLQQNIDSEHFLPFYSAPGQIDDSPNLNYHSPLPLFQEFPSSEGTSVAQCPSPWNTHQAQASAETGIRCGIYGSSTQYQSPGQAQFDVQQLPISQTQDETLAIEVPQWPIIETVNLQIHYTCDASNHGPHLSAAMAASPWPDGGVSLTSSPTSSASPTSERARRKGPLLGFQRENASNTRKTSACFRCAVMRESCIPVNPEVPDGLCQRCFMTLQNCRTFSLRCTRFKLENFVDFLLPRPIFAKLERNQLYKFIKAHAGRGVPGTEILLSLTIGYGRALRLPSVKIEPRDREAIEMCVFGVDGNNTTTTTKKIASPPLLPLLNYPRVRAKIVKDMEDLVELMVVDDTHFDPKLFFPEPHEHCEREILSAIHEKLRGSVKQMNRGGKSPTETLECAIRLAVLNDILTHPFTVPEGEVEALYAKLQEAVPSGAKKPGSVTSRFSNRMLKVMLVPFFTSTIQQVLTGLEYLLRSRNHSLEYWEAAFATVFLCLLSIGRFQNALVEQGEIRRREGDNSLTSDDITREIEKMEEELVIQFIGMFHQSFGTNKKANGNGKAFNPLARHVERRPQTDSPFAETLRRITAAHGSFNFGNEELSGIKQNEMRSQNVGRLIRKFMKPFFIDCT